MIADYKLQRAKGSNIWYKLVTLPRSTLATYSFGFNDSLEGWPEGPENPDGNFIERIAKYFPDPLNHGPKYQPFRDGLPDYYASIFGTIPTHHPTQDSVSVEKVEMGGRNCWHLRDSRQTKPSYILVLFDGDYYLNDLDIINSYSHFVARNLDIGLDLFLVESIQETRRTELFGGADFYRFIAESLANRLSTQNYSKVFLGGLSAGGYAAVRLATSFADRFAGALSQSGSFFWPESSDTALGRYPLVEQLESSNASLAHQRYSLQVGSFESLSDIDMVDCSAKMAQALRLRGAKTDYYVSDTCHEGIGWQAEFLRCLEGLLI
jgi:enterochelin esterase-like enzyme